MRKIAGPEIDFLLDISRNEVWFDASMCGFDSLSGIYIKVDNASNLGDIVDSFSTKINEIHTSVENEQLPAYCYRREEKYIVPRTFEEVLASYKKMCY